MKQQNGKVARARRKYLQSASSLESVDAYLRPSEVARLTRKVNREFNLFSHALAEARATTETTIE